MTTLNDKDEAYIYKKSHKQDYNLKENESPWWVL